MKLKKLLKKIFHRHLWETKMSTQYYDCSFGEPGFHHKTVKECQCSKCGAWKNFILKV
jgi:hypothetical protein